MRSNLYINDVKITKDIPKDNYLSKLPVVRNLMKAGGLHFDKKVTFLVGDAVIIGLNQGNPVESRVCTDLVLYFLTCKWWRLGRRRNNQNRTPYESWSVPGCPPGAGFKKVRGDIRYAIGL